LTVLLCSLSNSFCLSRVEWKRRRDEERES
jgi:hypothetical protein